MDSYIKVIIIAWLASFKSRICSSFHFPKHFEIAFDNVAELIKCYPLSIVMSCFQSNFISIISLLLQFFMDEHLELLNLDNEELNLITPEFNQYDIFRYFNY